MERAFLKKNIYTVQYMYYYFTFLSLTGKILICFFTHSRLQ